MKVFVAKRLGVSEGEAFCNTYVAKSRDAAIQVIVEESMQDWWRDYQGAEDEEEGREPASFQKIFDEYVRVWGDEETITIEEEEVWG